MKHEERASQKEIWRKYAPPLPNEFGCLQDAFDSLFTIVHFCQHLGSRVKFPEKCTHEGHSLRLDRWECRCCQSTRFRNIFGRYIDALYQGTQLQTNLTGTKIKNRAYGFRRWKRRLYFKLRRHPSVDDEYYAETEQQWCFDLDKRELILLGETRLGEHYAMA